MAKKFSSVEDLASYIKKSCHKDILDKISEDGIETMKEVTQDQVKGWTGDVIECIDETSRTNRSVELTWQDNGSWHSLSSKTKGKHMYAIWALENGTVWDWSAGSTEDNPIYKPPTTLEDTSTDIIERDSKETYVKVMRQKGFDVK